MLYTLRGIPAYEIIIINETLGGVFMSDLHSIILHSHNLVFFGGAGVSTESGIPDFRSSSGLYRTKTNYSYPAETLLSYSFFLNHPDVFYRYHRENIVHPEALPNAAHKTLAALEARGRLNAVITQNIDGLHQAAGSKKVLELHGTIHKNHCLNCGKEYPLSYILPDDPVVPVCSICGGIIRPNVVLYEEPLDTLVWEQAVIEIASADTLIVGGTSLQVYPAAGLISAFTGNKLVIINRETTPVDGQASLVLHEPIAEIFSKLHDDL